MFVFDRSGKKELKGLPVGKYLANLYITEPRQNSENNEVNDNTIKESKLLASSKIEVTQKLVVL
jgi:hypothetical protein